MASTGDGDVTMAFSVRDDPIVVAGVPSYTEGDSEAIVRIRSITEPTDTAGGTATFYIDVPNHSGASSHCGSSTHAVESFSWLVASAGTHSTWSAATASSSADHAVSYTHLTLPTKA